MKFAIIENGKVVNVAVAEKPLADNWIESAAAKVGDSYINGLFVEFDPTQDKDSIDNQEKLVREERDKLLASSDWTQVADAPVDKAAWAEYRQALRDITTQDGFPWSVEWPIAP
jgi:hypothetical protein